MTTPEPRRPRAESRVTMPPPAFCTLGATLCRVRVWTDAEWDDLPPADRPTAHQRVPGLGWVGAVPEQGLN